jgi:DMSO/TMAO reductase YedYZ molybdopterin-dependent catalytic subunit
VARRTNLALLALLALAFATGWLAFASATAPSRWSLAVHAVAGASIVLLVPWKRLASAGGFRRHRTGRWASLTLAGLVSVSLVFGWLHSTGVWRWGFGLSAMEFHVGAALLLLPLALWHVSARRVRPRSTDHGRRRMLQAATLGGAATAVYGGSELLTRVLKLPGSGRRFTGSYEVGSFEPAAMPVSSWMFDSVPMLDGARWRLMAPGREWTLAEVARFGDETQAVLDCTGGFYSEQEWRGAWLSRLLPAGASGSSLVVRSATGYERRFPLSEAARLLLATHLGGEQLDAEHGYPARLVAPDRRGFWWVKWVVELRVDEAPAWWQPPFPLQ